MEISHTAFYFIKEPTAKELNQSPVSLLLEQFYGAHIDCMASKLED